MSDLCYAEYSIICFWRLCNDSVLGVGGVSNIYVCISEDVSMRGRCRRLLLGVSYFLFIKRRVIAVLLDRLKSCVIKRYRHSGGMIVIHAHICSTL